MIKLTDLLDTKHTAGVCLIHMGQNVLMVKDHKGKWGIPKGHIRQGEETLDGALRELYEETKILVKEELEEVYKGKNKEGGDYCIFRHDIDDQIVPILSEEHTTWKYY